MGSGRRFVEIYSRMIRGIISLFLFKSAIFVETGSWPNTNSALSPESKTILEEVISLCPKEDCPMRGVK